MFILKVAVRYKIEKFFLMFIEFIFREVDVIIIVFEKTYWTFI